MAYVKLFSEIVHSTVWRLPAATKIVWVTMLALSDKFGDVRASIPGLADAARVTIEECELALVELSSPDPYSRTRDEDGRRIREIDGGWTLINHAKYRELQSLDDIRAKGAQRQRRFRANQQDSSTSVTSNVTSRMNVTGNVTLPKVSQTSADTQDALPITLRNACNDIRSDQISTISDHSDPEKEIPKIAPPPRSRRSRSASAFVYPEPFDSFWLAAQSNRTKGSKHEAFVAWEKVGRPELAAVTLAWTAYVASLGETFAKDVCRWIKHRGFEETYGAPPAPVVTRGDRTAGNIAALRNWNERKNA